MGELPLTYFPKKVRQAELNFFNTNTFLLFSSLIFTAGYPALYEDLTPPFDSKTIELQKKPSSRSSRLLDKTKS